MLDPGGRMCSSLLRDARIATILWICYSVAAAVANGRKRKTKGMSALPNQVLEASSITVLSGNRKRGNLLRKCLTFVTA